jgi:multimeric flavodoxin WrbA
MRVVGVSGSPRNAGNSEYLLNEALKVVEERGFSTQKLLCSELSIGFCEDCGACSRGRSCQLDDDMKAVLAALEQAEGMVIVSPVYFGSVTAQLKALFDRTIPLRRQGMKLKDKVGCAVTVGGARNGGQERAIESIHSWMHIHGMIIVGDNSHFGGIAVRPASEDRIGKNTTIASANKLCDLLERIEKKGGCWAGD